MKTIHNFHQVWRQFGFLPEYYNIPKSEAHTGREGYPLRPGISLILFSNVLNTHTEKKISFNFFFLLNLTLRVLTFVQGPNRF